MRYAWDFDLPEGTEVLAVRSGKVAVFQDKWPPEHCGGLVPIQNPPSGYVVSANIGNEANYVVIDHGDGTSALYLHLSKTSDSLKQKAKSGQPIQQGEVIGLSGKTGWTACGPHLHFQVQRSDNSRWFTDSIPASFSDKDLLAKNPDGLPKEGTAIISDNTPSSTAISNGISGTVYVDTNGNGAQDGGEAGSAGATVTLSGASLPKEATTDASGNYSFPNLQAGNYTLTLSVPSGYSATTSNPRSVTASGKVVVNFGIAAQSSSQPPDPGAPPRPGATPNPDRDNDGIPNTGDGCPDQPETWNNYQDYDGCPDESPGQPPAAPSPTLGPGPDGGTCDRPPSTPTNFSLIPGTTTLTWEVLDSGGSGCVVSFRVLTFGGQTLYEGTVQSFTLPTISCNSGYLVGAANQSFGFHAYNLWECPNP